MLSTTIYVSPNTYEKVNMRCLLKHYLVHQCSKCGYVNYWGIGCYFVMRAMILTEYLVGYLS